MPSTPKIPYSRRKKKKVGTQAGGHHESTSSKKGDGERVSVRLIAHQVGVSFEFRRGSSASKGGGDEPARRKWVKRKPGDFAKYACPRTLGKSTRALQAKDNEADVEKLRRSREVGSVRVSSEPTSGVSQIPMPSAIN